MNPEFVIVGEPSASHVVRYQKGILKVKIKVEGTPCHSGYPDMGDSALHTLLPCVNALLELENKDPDPDPLEKGG